MTSHHKHVVFAAALALSAGSSVTPDSAQAKECGAPDSQLRGDPLRSEGYVVVAAKQLYRVQDRPYAHIPTGAKLLVRAPTGVTAADLHRAASCSAHVDSPLSVPGARVSVHRVGDLYELHVTADKRSAALEIQHRARALSPAE